MLRANRMTPPSPNSRASDSQLDRNLLAVEAGDEQLADLPAKRGRRHGVQDSTYNSCVPIASSVSSSAPTRIDLAGGTIDIWPLYLFHDGASTLNAAISLRAHVAIEPRTDGAIELRSIDTEPARHARALVRARRVGRPAAARAARPALPARERHADDARRIAGRRRHRRLVRADHCLPAARSRAGRGSRCDAERSAAGRDERRVPDDPRADRRAGLPSRAVRRHRRHRAGRTASAAWRSTSTRASSNAASCSPTPARRATRARTTGRSPSGTSTATAHIFDCFERIRDTAVRDAGGARARATGTRSGRQIATEWDEPQAAGAGRHDAGDRRPDRARDGRGRDRRQGVRRRRRRLSLLLRPARRATAIAAALARGGARLLDYRIETEGLRVG